MRDPKPWFRDQKNAWFAQVNGKQHLLAKGKNNLRAAKQRLFDILTGKVVEKPNGISVAEICDKFLAFAQAELSRSTYVCYRHYLQLFCNLFGKRPAVGLIAHNLTELIAKNSHWNGAKRHAKQVRG